RRSPGRRLSWSAASAPVMPWAAASSRPRALVPYSAWLQAPRRWQPSARWACASASDSRRASTGKRSRPDRARDGATRSDQALRERVRAALRAAAERAAGPRFLATAFACRDNAVGLAALLPSRFSAVLVARDRRGETAPVLRLPAALASFALRRVFAGASPFAGGLSATPARRAF